MLTLRTRNLYYFMWLVRFLAPVVFVVTTERTDQLVNGSDCILTDIASVLVKRVGV
jgi:hypothetical protein